MSDLLGGLRGWESKGQNSFFSVYGHVAYQIKGNHKCSNMIANILPSDSPSDLGGGVKRSNFYFFQNMVMLHIKLKQITYAVIW